jgi:hypothetical protein
MLAFQSKAAGRRGVTAAGAWLSTLVMVNNIVDGYLERGSVDAGCRDSSSEERRDDDESFDFTIFMICNVYLVVESCRLVANPYSFYKLVKVKGISLTIAHKTKAYLSYFHSTSHSFLMNCQRFGVINLRQGQIRHMNLGWK